MSKTDLCEVFQLSFWVNKDTPPATLDAYSRATHNFTDSPTPKILILKQTISISSLASLIVAFWNIMIEGPVVFGFA